MRRKGDGIEMLWLFILLVIVVAAWVKIAAASEARLLRLDDKKIGRVFVSFGKSTVLSFPSKPSKVILGNKGAFSLEYIDADLAVASLHPNAVSNLFVYVQGRRFAIDLVSSSKNPDEVVIIRDVLSEQTYPKGEK